MRKYPTQTHARVSSTPPLVRWRIIQFCRGTNRPSIRTHEILNKSIMCWQSEQQNCLLLPVTQNAAKSTILAIAFKRAQQHFNSINGISKWSVKTMHYHHSRTCCGAAHFLRVSVSVGACIVTISRRLKPQHFFFFSSPRDVMESL